ncbi:predicted protein [Sclerotinia sclerotiorum 1980 UF-70]|uniref:Uncharacterized protein n=1 Tax=Sclerotinia sclerotiorum (strain ATCC 18683 / 1980 / Ss-1) TaxID=665079 RepID=A7F3W7_SCLS1|nr:predicted protein [Sclerotinia sclerotiorum 1980 UF-70]EDN97438.1 predicted protein [Sclerotinia sclerotiorum 1980 UF-70]
MSGLHGNGKVIQLDTDIQVDTNEEASYLKPVNPCKRLSYSSAKPYDLQAQDRLNNIFTFSSVYACQTGKCDSALVLFLFIVFQVNIYLFPLCRCGLKESTDFGSVVGSPNFLVYFRSAVFAK